MNTLEILLQQIGLFVIYILAGMILVKTKVLNSETLDPISRFVIKMALPVMIFVNIMLVAYFSATANPRPAIIGSLLRGAIAIGICAIILSRILGMNGVWLSFLASEMITFAVILILSKYKESRKTNEYA